MSRALSIACAAIAAGALVTASSGHARAEHTFSLVVHVAREADAPVQNDAWIDAQIAQAERLFGPTGVHFTRGASRPLADRFTHLETRADRDKLGAELDKGKISVMIVGSLRDVDDPRLLRQGVHWRPAATPSKHYVIVASTAGPTTLAHELGHFFGNGHTAIQNNLMSYDRTSDEVFLTDGQKKMIGAFAGIYFRSKELVAQ